MSRFSTKEIAREVVHRGVVAQISGTTVWRWLNEDAIKPWYHRSWIFPRDPAFEEKASRILDLYQGIWEGQPLSGNDYVICADEKTRIQARIRKHPTEPPQAENCLRVEHEYERGGILNYLAAWEVRRARVFGRCEGTTGIIPFTRLINQVMRQEPYRSARRVFWIMDNGSSHRGEATGKRLQKWWPNIVVVHLPIHASWLNQIEIYFSIIQRKVLTPNYFTSLKEIEDRLFQFQLRYEQIAKPFAWKFTKTDLSRLLAKISSPSDSLPLAA